MPMTEPQHTIYKDPVTGIYHAAKSVIITPDDYPKGETTLGHIDIADIDAKDFRQLMRKALED